MVIRLFTGTILGGAALVAMALDRGHPSPPADPAPLVARHSSPATPPVPPSATASRKRDGRPSPVAAKVVQP